MDIGPVSLPLLELPIYFVHAFVQELLMRGFVQTASQKFMDDERGLKSVLLTALFFGMGHAHLGLVAIGLIAGGGFVLGLFYLRHRHVFGNTLLHWTMGCCVFYSGLLY